MSGRAAPVLDREMVLETRAMTPDGGGGLMEGWQALGTLWAAVERPSVRLVREGALEITAVKVRILVRAAPVGRPRRPKVGQRLREGDRVYRILGVEEYDRAAHYLQLWAEEGGA
ncbi:head-tail adaptor protein [Roseobacter sp. HKCCA0434]|uniref:head-tail adaptor protein n=1 Tax=Roseobacter sp. HKCCA0434 TaxID=3079297 RepID=UPI002905D00E|nr:head-tail adaptor protein [Roseobacter sp. HKCCA0434]